MNEEDLRLAKVLVNMDLNNKDNNVRKTVVGKVKEKIFSFQDCDSLLRSRLIQP
ncbi:hypothetical protein Phum_PHUM127730 [Pediculus humanus corporis]|uniref:Uncharacterized protein n=1 Tax=Pediculus humanus subsp. corporis TaxID=121224 RepID=E0VE16_PEDHC|nr:uncharacterized protein Phum_PHUM127730 [Pediculus humanus corporis]EEB11622.1 hypothetical protein Phum_PHUM127730 [Pediculus humanus corporis]